MLLEIGQTIPDITLPNQEGQELRLKDLLGARGGIFYFYPKDNTPGCTREAKDFQAQLPAFQELGFTVIGISRDSVKSHVNFASKHQLGFTLLSDTEGQACSDFGVWQEKKMCGRTSMGIVRTTFIVDTQGRVTKVYEQVKTTGHVDKLLADLT
ncbi:MAG: thioredoxin-dependent thiol peroxidase [Magnetococcus sp. DMHC-6]